MSQLTNLQRVMAAEDLPSASISSNETKLSALVIAHAILNPLIHLPLKGSLVKHSKRKNEPSMRFGHRHVPELDGRDMDPLADAIFGHGRLMNSPATFQQGHLDKVYESSNLKIPAVKEWLHEICYAEEFWNSISGLVLPDLARVSKDAIAAKGDWVVTQPPSGTQWPSIYVGIDVIVNQETPPHLDKVSAPSLLDLLAIFHPTKGSLGKIFKDLVPSQVP
ncbi:hypothetical protein F5141DRAFT_1061736 [Pisolithus sp. B1]|nr:hypothetical protein F5141DRAFT_1061736 [Pisolithus sp. B1]